ncbi:MAG: aromatic ring-hydroxylating dioxygenase subunit alpha [Hydrogenophaga sp.]|uniref:aromatic ring-hydroxylating oxygenase subunit alpha n=1 Tax=Hydrogenophaga sp. TaxID=1904254 RepID=UPI001E05256E|nr:aromatic ring-hydroxylating dioxygenase subunit alpha [Hydrogenophaga sp.]MBX3609878.1 aromatic ring-hydroxylating dioxygenase subunit alpha [Hydrogenophaga sp.]
MQHDEQVRLIRRALALIAAGDSERGEATLSPVARYLDPARFEREREHVICRHPVAVCPSAQLARPGDTLAVDLAGLPVLLVRGEGGELRGFVNACRHRGARLLDAGEHSKRVLICPYHSWSYRLDGTLAGRPHAADFAHAPPGQCALARVAVGESLGLVWVVPRVLAPDESAVLDLRAHLGRFAQDLRHWGYDLWVPFHQRSFTNAANWKIPFEGNLETYHFQYAHRDSIAPLFHDNLLIADHDGDHQRLLLPKRSMAGLRDQDPAQWDIGRHSNIIYFFFPATFILHEGDHANLFSVWPEAVDRSTVRAITLIPELPATEKARAHWRKNVDSFWGALDEDFALGVSCQSTLASGANTHWHFGRTECSAARFHAAVERLSGLTIG